MIQAYINNIPYDMTRDFLLTDMVGNKSTSEITVRVDDQPLPRAGDMVEIKDDDTVLFWGMLGIPQSPKYTTGNEWRVYTMTAGSANAFLSRRIINEAFKRYTVSEIVRVLFDNYIAEEGITLGAEVYRNFDSRLPTLIIPIIKLPLMYMRRRILICRMHWTNSQILRMHHGRSAQTVYFRSLCSRTIRRFLPLSAGATLSVRSGR